MLDSMYHETPGIASSCNDTLPTYTRGYQFNFDQNMNMFKLLLEQFPDCKHD